MKDGRDVIPGHGNTPAAWAAVAIAMVGFVIGSIACMGDPVNMTLFWIGVVLGVAAFPAFLIMARMGLNNESH